MWRNKRVRLLSLGWCTCASGHPDLHSSAMGPHDSCKNHYTHTHMHCVHEVCGGTITVLHTFTVYLKYTVYFWGHKTNMLHIYTVYMWFVRKMTTQTKRQDSTKHLKRTAQTVRFFFISLMQTKSDQYFQQIRLLSLVRCTHYQTITKTKSSEI